MSGSQPPPLPRSVPPAPLPLRTGSRAPVAPTPRDDESTVIYVTLAAIISLFLATGLAWVLFADNIPWADADFYFQGAKSIAEGDGYSHPFRSGNPPTAFHPVGYPWLLAHVWNFLGIDTSGCDVSSWPNISGCDAMIQSGQIVNLLLAAANIGLVFALGSLLKGPRIGLLAAALFALIPSRLIFTSALMSEEAFVTLVLLALIMLVFGVRRQEWMWLTAIGFGLAIGGATFIRPLGIVLLPLPLLLLSNKVFSTPRVFTHLAISGFVALLLLLPWTIRNHKELGGWNLVSNNGGINLWIGCHLNGDGELAADGRWRDWWSGDAPRSLNTSDERANDRKAQSLALDCMRDEPLAFARLSLVKGVYTFQEDWTYVSKWALNHRLPERSTSAIVSDGTEDVLSYLSNSVYFVLLPLAAVGAATTLTAPSLYRGLLGAAFAVLALVPLMFFGEPRFHVPLLPIMSIWAAEGLRVIVEGLRAARRAVPEAATEGRAPASTYAYDWKEDPWRK